MTRLVHPYADILPTVLKPGRYVGREPGCVLKPEAPGQLSICLAFPEVYEIGMSYLGFQILYHRLADEPRVVTERAFAPWPDLEAALRERNLPLVSQETWRPLAAFDVLGFTLQYELTYANLLNMLDLGGIPLRSSARSAEHPLVIAGGPLAANPEPLSAFVDAFLLGDGEDLLPGFLNRLLDLRAAGVSRADALVALEAWSPHVYVPALHPTRSGADGRVLRDAPPRTLAHLLDLAGSPEPVRFPTPWVESTFDRISVEIARGCTQGCRFCQAGYLYRPLREKPVARLVDDVARHVEASGHAEVSLASLSSADYSDLGGLVRPLAELGGQKGFSLAFSSLRAYGLPEDVLVDVARLGVPGLTLAPEAGTERLRAVINKNVTDEQLLSAVERCFALGWQRVKLYFMIGLPTETDDDVLSILTLGRRVFDAGRAVLRRKPEVVVSVSGFVPKPHTPFQWCGADRFDEIRRKQRLLLDAVRPTPLRLKLHNAGMGRVESWLALGDARAGDVIEAAWKGGARFDGWTEHFHVEGWEAAAASVGVKPDEWTLPVDVAAPLPWDFVSAGVSRAFLVEEHARSLRAERTLPCEVRLVGETRTSGRCLACGVGCLDVPIAEKSPAYVSPGAAPSVIHRAPDAPPALLGPAFHVRYGRLAPTHLLGQNDAVRHLVLAIRRSGYTLELSQGFNPRPRVSQSTALPFGYESLSEWLGLRFAPHGAPEGPDQVLALPAVPGMPFLEARAVRPEDYRLRDDRVLAWRFLVEVDDPPAARAVIDAEPDLRLDELQEAERRLLGDADARALVLFVDRSLGRSWRPERWLPGVRRVVLLERRP
jgi:radical SAM family uncharacterized protein